MGGLVSEDIGRGRRNGQGFVERCIGQDVVC